MKYNRNFENTKDQIQENLEENIEDLKFQLHELTNENETLKESIKEFKEVIKNKDLYIIALEELKKSFDSLIKAYNTLEDVLNNNPF